MRPPFTGQLIPLRTWSKSWQRKAALVSVEGTSLFALDALENAQCAPACWGLRAEISSATRKEIAAKSIEAALVSSQPESDQFCAFLFAVLFIIERSDSLFCLSCEINRNYFPYICKNYSSTS